MFAAKAGVVKMEPRYMGLFALHAKKRASLCRSFKVKVGVEGYGAKSSTVAP